MGGSDVPGEEHVGASGGTVVLFDSSIPIIFVAGAF
jgi:hypothetical protein